MATSPKYGWQEAFVAALRDTDPMRSICRVESAVAALERRFAEWDEDPGSETENQAIRQAISALQTLLEMHLRKSA
jgi:hypothetical protein